MIRSNIDNYEEINCHASATFTVQQGKGMDTLVYILRKWPFKTICKDIIFDLIIWWYLELDFRDSLFLFYCNDAWTPAPWNMTFEEITYCCRNLLTIKYSILEIFEKNFGFYYQTKDRYSNPFTNHRFQGVGSNLWIACLH